LLTGFAIYSPWLFHWIAPLFGGGPRARALHPWFGLVFEVFFLFQFINWFAPMAWGEADRRWMKRMGRYVKNEDPLEAEDVGFFNAGQKLYFWAIAVSAVLFLITGLLMWFDNLSGRWIVAVSYVIHDLAALLMLAGFIIHVYEGTAHQPGTFRSMIEGTVTERWAWTHHPGWFRAVTGRDAREAFEREKRRQEEER
jgi:formate dehydrogenase subunit gamma